MRRARFSWRGFGVGLVFAWVAVGALWALSFDGAALLFGHFFGENTDTFWAVALAVFWVSGLMVGRVASGLGFWECTAVWVLSGAAAYTHLRWGFSGMLGLGADANLSAWDVLDAPGQRYFGPMWDRTLAMMLAGAFLLLHFGSSLSYLFGQRLRHHSGARSFEWFVARRHLFADGKRILSLTAVVAIVGIALGVAALIAVTAVMSGYQEDIRERILSTNAHLVVQKYGIDFTEYEDVVKKALGVEGVLAATPFAFNEAMLSDGEQALGVLIKGVVPETAGSVTSLETNLCDPAQTLAAEGQCAPNKNLTLVNALASAAGVPSVVLGFELYKKMSVHVGQDVVITTPVGIAGARGNAPKRMNFRVGGVFRSGMHEFDARLAYLTLPAAQELFGLGHAVHGVELRLVDADRAEEFSRKVLHAVGQYPYRTLDWRRLNLSIFTALHLQKIVMYLMLTLIVVVAAFNIASTLFMSVVERARDIAVMRSMGATDRSVMNLFVLQGWVVGGLGTLLGVGLGLLVCLLISKLSIGIAADVYMVDSLKVRVWPLEVLVTVLAAFVISHLATLHPAQRAARQNPVDAMRND